MFVRPFTIFCPSLQFSDLLLPIWPPFLHHVAATLSPAWEAHAARSVANGAVEGAADRPAATDVDGEDGDGEDQSDDILHERELRDASRSLADVLVLIFSPRQHLGACVRPRSSDAKRAVQ